MAVAIEVAGYVPAADLPALAETLRVNATIPRDLDARLLAKASAALGADLEAEQKRRLRELFRASCEKVLLNLSSTPG
jgi:hypothetical protein